MNERDCLLGTYNASAPQDWAQEVAPIEQACRLLDDRIRIVWNPIAYLARPGAFDAHGKTIPPLYEGRYQVVVPGALDGQLVALHTLGNELGPHKPYRAVGPWLIEFLQRWDTQNVHHAEAMRTAIAESDAANRRAEDAAAALRKYQLRKLLRDKLNLRDARVTVPISLTTRGTS